MFAERVSLLTRELNLIQQCVNEIDRYEIEVVLSKIRPSGFPLSLADKRLRMIDQRCDGKSASESESNSADKSE